MKNFKLLLATTAILSTGAIAAFADSSYTDTAYFAVNIALFESAKITVIEDGIDFGALVKNGDTTGTKVRLNASSGMREINNTGVIEGGDRWNYGHIAVNVPDGYTATFTLDDNVTLTSVDTISEYTLNFVPEIAYAGDINVTYDSVGGFFMKDYVIGGEIGLSNAVFKGRYTGTTTVTVVVSEDSTSGDNNG